MPILINKRRVLNNSRGIFFQKKVKHQTIEKFGKISYIFDLYFLTLSQMNRKLFFLFEWSQVDGLGLGHPYLQEIPQK